MNKRLFNPIFFGTIVGLSVLTIGYTLNGFSQKGGKVPNAFVEGPSSRIGSFSKGRVNLIEELFNDALKADQALDKLYFAIEGLYLEVQDSTKDYQTYCSNHQKYHNEALLYINRISDSSVAKSTQYLLDNHTKQFEHDMSAHQNQIEDMALKKERLADLEILLKLAVTLPLLDDYQDNARPAIAPIQQLNTKYDHLIHAIQQRVTWPDEIQ